MQANEAEDLRGAAAPRRSALPGWRVAWQLGALELRIRVAADEPLLVRRVDSAQTLRVLVNLIENAAKYWPLESSIDLPAG